MSIDERRWKIVQRHLGYSNEEMFVFREDVRNEDVLSKGAELMNKLIILEVVESHGCNSFKRAGCFDVGLECGGWGRIVLELRVEENLAMEKQP